MQLTIPDRFDILTGGKILIPSSHFVLVTTQHLYETYGHYFEIPCDKTLFIENNTVEHLGLAISGLPSKRFFYHPNDYPLLVGFGGGKVIDATKYLAHVLQTPYMSIPTTLSNDGICSPVAVLNSTKGQVRFGVSSPKSVIIMLPIIQQAPVETVRSGVGDLLSNIVALRDWKLAHRRTGEDINLLAYSLSELATYWIFDWISDEEPSIFDERNLDFLKALAKSLVLSGLAMEITGNSRPCSGGEHLFSHAIDKLLPDNTIPHGFKVAFGSLLTWFLYDNPLNWNLYASVFDTIKLPRTLAALGVPLDVAVQALVLAPQLNPHKYTILHEKAFDPSGAEAVLKEFA